MNLNARKIIKVMGFLLVIIGLFLMLPTIVAIYYSESNAMEAFSITAFSCIFGGLFLALSVKDNHQDLRTRDGFFIAVMAWILMSLVGALPFYINGCIPHFYDAFFESCSGFSTTGSTILNDIRVLPKSMMFWRMFSHWIGGMGILVFTVALLPALGTSGQTIVRYESPGPTLSKLQPKMSDTAKTLYAIYCGMTLLETVLLKIAGMSWFDAITHSFSTVGTGGFSNYNESIAYFNSPAIESIITVFMLLAGVNFTLYFLLICGRGKELLWDSEFKLYLLIIALDTVLNAITLYATDTYQTLADCFHYAAFQVAAILTTTGFGISDYDVWPTFCRALILLLFFVGGCASSTGGGVKVIRITILLKAIQQNLSVRLHPNSTTQIKVNKKAVANVTVENIYSFTILYIVVVFATMFLVSFDGHDMITNFSTAITCIGNVGPGFNDIGPSVNFSGFSPVIKMILSLVMIIGRLELYTFFIVFTPSFWNTSR